MIDTGKKRKQKQFNTRRQISGADKKGSSSMSQPGGKTPPCVWCLACEMSVSCLTNSDNKNYNIDRELRQHVSSRVHPKTTFGQN